MKTVVGLCIFSLLVGLVILLTIMKSEEVQSQSIQQQQVVMENLNIVAESESYIAALSDSKIDVYKKNVNSVQLFVGIGGDTTHFIGNDAPLPRNYFDKEGYILGSFDRDIVDTEFGQSAVIWENSDIPNVGENPAVIAVGAPGATNGEGAVYIFSFGSEGLWLEAKITPPKFILDGLDWLPDLKLYGYDDSFEDGFGITVTLSEKKEFLEILDKQGRRVSIPLRFFLMVG